MSYSLIDRNGGSFWANIWTWPAIQAVVASTGAVEGDLMPDRYVSADEATRIADELRRVLPGLDERFEAGELPDGVRDIEKMFGPVRGIGSRGEPQASCYVYKEKLAEFADFCWNSGGFHIDETLAKAPGGPGHSGERPLAVTKQALKSR
jgi:hypothetical protein